MAILTAGELAILRQRCARDLRATGINWSKSDINDVMQALEDWYETTGKSDLSTEIDNAGSFVWTNPQKKILGAYFWLRKASREGAT
jgi:hypothetical protein